MQSRNPLGQQTDTGRQTEQEKTKPWRTGTEVREQSPHNMVRL